MIEDHLAASQLIGTVGVGLPSTKKATMLPTSHAISSIYIANQQFPFILQPTAQPTAGPGAYDV